MRIQQRLKIRDRRELQDYLALTLIIGFGLFVSIMAFNYTIRNQLRDYEKNALLQSSRVKEHLSLLLNNQLLSLNHIADWRRISRKEGKKLLKLNEDFLLNTLPTSIDLVKIEVGAKEKSVSIDVLESDRKNPVIFDSYKALGKIMNGSLGRKGIDHKDVVVVHHGPTTDAWNVAVFWQVNPTQKTYLVAWIPLAKILPQYDDTFDINIVIKNAQFPDSEAVKIGFQNIDYVFSELKTIPSQAKFDLTQYVANERFLGANLRVGYISSTDPNLAVSWAVLAVGILVSILVSLLVYELISRNSEVQDLVVERTRDLAQLTIEAEKANEAKSRFLANMSHEIRTPLNIILGMADLLAETRLTPHQEVYVQNFNKSGKHLLGLIEEILDMVRLELEQVVFERGSVNLSEVFNEVGALCYVPCRNKKVRFSQYLDPHIPRLITGDGRRIRQILLNLVNNAIKFTDAGSVSLAIYWVPESSIGTSLRLEVRDTGIGMSEEETKRIFSEFVQVDPSSTRNRGGVGLGLAIVRSIARKMGGQVTVETELGKGSKFIATIPVEVKDANSWLEEFREPAKKYADKSFLLLSDDDLEAEYVSQAANYLGLKVTRMSSGSSFLAGLTDLKSKYDYFILDTLIHDFGAIELLKRKAMSQAIKNKIVVLLPSLHRRLDLEVLAKIGISKICYKPVAIKALFEVFAREGQVAPVEQGVSGAKLAFDRSFDRSSKILVVEDDESNRHLIKAYLEPFSLDVTFCDNAKDAILRFEQVRPRLILTDIQMPEMDGFQLAKTIRRMEQAQQMLPSAIFALTADALPEHAELSRSAGIDEYLTKPISKSDLLDALLRAQTTNKRAV